MLSLGNYIFDCILYNDVDYCIHAPPLALLISRHCWFVFYSYYKLFCTSDSVLTANSFSRFQQQF